MLLALVMLALLPACDKKGAPRPPSPPKPVIASSAVTADERLEDSLVAEDEDDEDDDLDVEE